MSNDIQPGDVVVCVDTHGCDWFLRKGTTYRVELINPALVCEVCGDDGPCIQVVGDPANALSGNEGGGYCQMQFRKIEAPKTELSERIRKCRPLPVKEVV